MTFYRKRPIDVQAVLWDGSGDSMTDVRELLDQSPSGWTLQIIQQRLMVCTIDGNWVEVPLGGYVVLDSKNFAYPCDREVFEAGHDRIPTPSAMS